jgi:signal peptidase I
VASAALIVLAGRSSLADHYQVPSGSMQPSVEVGDRVVVSKLAYGLRLPFNGLYLWRGLDPRPGDVVVLVSPADGITLLKRVIAGPGDLVEVRDGHVTVNGAAADLVEVRQGAVEVLGGRAHPVSLARGGGPAFGPLRIPADRYLVMGDNRGDSFDGRSFGLVGRGAILGRALAVFHGRTGLTWRPL